MATEAVKAAATAATSGYYHTYDIYVIGAIVMASIFLILISGFDHKFERWFQKNVRKKKQYDADDDLVESNGIVRSPSIKTELEDKPRKPRVKRTVEIKEESEPIRSSNPQRRPRKKPVEPEPIVEVVEPVKKQTRNRKAGIVTSDSAPSPTTSKRRRNSDS